MSRTRCGNCEECHAGIQCRDFPAPYYPSGIDGGRPHVELGGRVFPAEPLVDPSDRDSVIAWLAWHDPTGCYTDADSALAQMPPLDLDAALKHLEEAVEQEEMASL